MARELSQEAVLDFLWAAGGRAPNTALLRHFQRFLRDPALTEQQRRERREYFKSLVNSLATVHPAAAPGASKDIVLRRRYRDLLDEDLSPPEEQREEENKEPEPPPPPPPPPRRDPAGRRGPRGEAAGQGRPCGGQPPGAAVSGGCSARGRGGPCCECRRALRAAAAAVPAPGPAGAPRARCPPPPRQPPPYRTQPLSAGPGPLPPGGTRLSRPPVLPPGPGALAPAVPPRSLSPPLPAAGQPSVRPSRSRSPPLPSGPELLPRDRPPQPPTGMPLLKAPPPSANPRGRPPAGPSQSPLLSSGPRALSLTELSPSRSLPLLSAPVELPPSQSLSLLSPTELPPSRSLPLLSAPVELPPSQSLSLLSPTELPPSRSLPLLSPTELPPSRSLPLLSAPGVLPLSRSLQTLPASPSSSPRLLPDPEVLPSTRLPPSQSRSLQQLPTRPSPALPRGPRGLTSNGPTHPQVLLLYPCQTLTLPAGPGVVPRTTPSQSLPQSPTQPAPSRFLQPRPAGSPPSQSLQPAQGPAEPQAPESCPPAPLPVFRSIRCQLALSEVQDTPAPLPEDCERQPRTTFTKGSPRKALSRGPAVPLGQREHAWLVAMSAGCWARVRGLFLEEPELALQRDFMSGFTVLHWLAKHGDGPGLQELAAAAQRVGLALDVDARSGCGYTPLHLAAIHGHQFVIKVLVLQLGCQVQVRDSSGRRPWEYLRGSNSGEIWQLLEAPRGTIMFPTQPLARSVSSASKDSLSTGRAALPSCLRVQHGRGAASRRASSESD
ncbi:ankyrin repeat domain-containing protein SOWAHB [Pithys albifrons albifrons]|uniref:ankyrin repeat domain-containing protein SOWAHB n=1 Tax=Pithys albifrons albifrons TaxID=3385563 RepID=UPI003A5D0B19